MPRTSCQPVFTKFFYRLRLIRYESNYIMSRFIAYRPAQVGHDDHQAAELQQETNVEVERVINNNINWVPHPRSGIYFPEGQDWVLEDVPEDAAYLGQGHTYWLRNIEGVEKHDPDVPTADYYLAPCSPSPDP